MMKKNYTFSILKPDCIIKNYIGLVLNKIIEKKFKIKALKMVKFSKEKAKLFYNIHIGKLFFSSLISFMSSGPIIVMVLEKYNAVNDFRELIGSTNPNEAKKNTIRNLYAESIEKNIIHGSDTIENAIREIKLNFSLQEIFI